jgi:enoyl-CoA hydratase/carnithine racemase
VTGLRIERSAHVWWLTLNRPNKLNALDDPIRRGLDNAIHELQDSRDVRVVVLNGAGRSFSAGADTTTWDGDGLDDDRWARRRRRSGGWQRTLDGLESLAQTTVASIHGHCIGGAALLAVSCDLRVGDSTVSVRIPELALGIPLTWGGIPRLAREVGLPLTRDLVMTGRTLDAHAALACGFLQRLAPAGGLADVTARIVDELLAMPHAPQAVTKALTSALGRQQTVLAGWADADLLAWSLREPEARAAATAYLQTRSTRRPAADH